MSLPTLSAISVALLDIWLGTVRSAKTPTRGLLHLVLVVLSDPPGWAEALTLSTPRLWQSLGRHLAVVRAEQPISESLPGRLRPVAMMLRAEGAISRRGGGRRLGLAICSLSRVLAACKVDIGHPAPKEAMEVLVMAVSRAMPGKAMVLVMEEAMERNNKVAILGTIILEGRDIS